MSTRPEPDPTMDESLESSQVKAEIHHEHRDVSGGWLRPAVFGVMDGLVSNLALIAGVVGGDVATTTIVLAGLAGVLAGSISMATGEYTSVASQGELARAEIAVEKAEISQNPEAEMRELAGVYRARGVDPDLAMAVAKQLSRNPDQVWRVHAREELGVDPDGLPSPWTAAISSFLSFTIGALIPVLPYLFGADSLTIAAVASACGLFAAGAFTSRFTNRSWLYSGARQFVLGMAAAAVTFGVGHLIGIGLG